ncbi:hypothetical protein C2E23DRAFT_66090 [Lenzites betulinus]|nr:hypothetical protein C2E23DRAFT_66090 [Lenzites betulinus]
MTSLMSIDSMMMSSSSSSSSDVPARPSRVACARTEHNYDDGTSPTHAPLNFPVHAPPRCPLPATRAPARPRERREHLCRSPPPARTFRVCSLALFQPVAAPPAYAYVSPWRPRTRSPASARHMRAAAGPAADERERMRDEILEFRARRAPGAPPALGSRACVSGGVIDGIRMGRWAIIVWQAGGRAGGASDGRAAADGAPTVGNGVHRHQLGRREVRRAPGHAGEREARFVQRSGGEAHCNCRRKSGHGLGEW